MLLAHAEPPAFDVGKGSAQAARFFLAVVDIGHIALTTISSVGPQASLPSASIAATQRLIQTRAETTR